MKPIETILWKPVQDKPQYVTFDRGRPVQAIFDELQSRLALMGFLPDEYFLINDDWKDKEFPETGDIYTVTNFGGNEGIYIDVYIKWTEDEKRHDKSFITGKTLGETKLDLDRMHLTASEITHAFYGNDVHARYISSGDKPHSGEILLHLDEQERQLMTEILITQMERLRSENQPMEAVEHLARRIVGGDITYYLQMVGFRPIKLSAYDRAVLAVHDSNLQGFLDACKETPEEHPRLLCAAAGHSGRIGGLMTSELLTASETIRAGDVIKAVVSAMRNHDMDRIFTMLETAREHVADWSTESYGLTVQAALREGNKSVAMQLIDRASKEQVQAFDPHILVQIMGDYNYADMLLWKGINIEPIKTEVFYAAACQTEEWKRSVILHKLANNGWDINDTGALRHSVLVGNTAAALTLMEHGADFAACEDLEHNENIAPGARKTFDALQEQIQPQRGEDEDEWEM